MAAPAVSVVVPVFDEQESLWPLHRELDAALSSLSGGVEFIFVDDGSRDESLAVLRELEAKDPRVCVVALVEHAGQSAALDAGFRRVRGAVTVTLDADLQNDPADIPALLAALDAADVVGGVRIGRRDPPLRILASRIANAVRNRATGESVSDVGCSLRAMRTRFLRKIVLFRGSHRFLPTLLRMQGARLAEVPVSHRPRRFGRSKYGIGDRLWVGIADLLAIRWMQKRALRYRVRSDREDGNGDVG